MKVFINSILVLSLSIVLFLAGCKDSAPAAPSATAVINTTTSTITPTITATSSKTVSPTITMTRTVTPTVTMTITPDISPKLFSFETNNDGWVPEVSDAITSMGRSTTMAHTGSASLKISCAFSTSEYTASTIKQFTSAAINMKGKTFSMWVYVPASLGAASPAYGTHLYMYDFTGWHNINGPVLSGSNTWQNVTITVPLGFPADDYIQKVVFWIFKTNTSTPDWSGDIYVDDISW